MRDLTKTPLNNLQTVLTRRDLANLPHIHVAEKVPRDRRMAYVHFCTGAVDYWVHGFDPKNEVFLVSTRGCQGPETGRLSVRDLIAVREGGQSLERDVAWLPRVPVLDR